MVLRSSKPSKRRVYTPGIGISRWEGGRKVSLSPTERFAQMKNVFEREKMGERRKVQLMERMILVAMSNRRFINATGAINHPVLMSQLGGKSNRKIVEEALKRLYRKGKIKSHGSKRLEKVA